MSFVVHLSVIDEIKAFEYLGLSQGHLDSFIAMSRNHFIDRRV